MNLQTFVSDEDLVARFRRRFVKWKEQNYVKGDALLLPVFDELLAWDNAAPVFSCQGHNPDEGAHVIFSVNSDGLIRLSSYYRALRDRLIEMYEKDPDNKGKQRFSPFGLQLVFTTRATSIRQEEPEPYPAVLLTTWPFPQEEMRVKFIDIMLDELKRFNQKE